MSFCPHGSPRPEHPPPAPPTQFEAAAKRAADQITAPRPDDAPVRDIQIMLSSDQNPLLLRQLHVCFLLSVTRVSPLHPSIAHSAMHENAVHLLGHHPSCAHTLASPSLLTCSQFRAMFSFRSTRVFTFHPSVEHSAKHEKDAAHSLDPLHIVTAHLAWAPPPLFAHPPAVRPRGQADPDPGDCDQGRHCQDQGDAPPHPLPQLQLHKGPVPQARHQRRIPPPHLRPVCVPSPVALLPRRPLPFPFLLG